MARPMWIVNLLKMSFGLRYFGAEMTKWPVIGRVMEHALFNGHRSGDALFYLPKDRVIVDEAIDDQANLIVPSEVVTHFIHEAKHIFLMNSCICCEAADCQAHDHDIGCIFLGEAVLEINPPPVAHECRAGGLGERFCHIWRSPRVIQTFSQSVRMVRTTLTPFGFRAGEMHTLQLISDR